jgi:hypothetical protein
MKCFISHKGVVSDKPTREEDTLLRADNVIKNMFDSVGYGFGDDFEHDITEGNRSKVRWEGWLFVFGYKTDKSIVKRPRAATIVENIKDVTGNIFPYDVPEALKEIST